MTFKAASNQPSIKWMYDRVKEGTPATCAIQMMHEEGYALDNKMFMLLYQALKRRAGLAKNANVRAWRRRRERDHTGHREHRQSPTTAGGTRDQTARLERAYITQQLV